MDASKDHALPAGTCTEQTLERVLGCESEVSIPLRCSCCGQDGDGGFDGVKGSGSSRLVLKLRQVNGDGVLSGVRQNVPPCLVHDTIPQITPTLAPLVANLLAAAGGEGADLSIPFRTGGRSLSVSLALHTVQLSLSLFLA